MDALRSVTVADVTEHLSSQTVDLHEPTDRAGRRWIGPVLMVVVAIWLLGDSTATSATNPARPVLARPERTTACASSQPEVLDADELFWAAVESARVATDC